MKSNTCLVVDVWEGQLEIDEAALKAGGVAGMGIRINDMSGGHHMDATFGTQWTQASGFVRFPYFVYNPWVDGQANYAWLLANMPNDAYSVAVDVEVAYPGYAANKYAGELIKFLDLCNLRWKTIIYTAEWFLPYLASWPKMDYWWAQYPNSNLIDSCSTWEMLKIAMNALDKPYNTQVIPGNLKMWQFSGDKLVLPGTLRKTDISIFYGTETELTSYFGGTVVIPVPAPTSSISVTVVSLYGVNVRVNPGINEKKVSELAYGTKFSIINTITDSKNVWGQISLDQWVCMNLNGITLVSVDTVSEFPKLMRIGEDYEVQGKGTRPYLRNGLPPTVRMKGGKGQMNLSDIWIKFVNYMNTIQNQNYIWKVASGWHNQGDSNNVVAVSFAGNIVNILGISENQAFVDTYHDSDTPPTIAPPMTVDHLTDNLRIQYFTAGYTDHLDFSNNGKYPRIVLIGNDGEKLWFDIGDLMHYEEVRKTVTITNSSGVNLRPSPYTGCKPYRVLPKGSTKTIYGISRVGSKVWFRTDLNEWICGKDGSTHYTDWLI